MKSNSIIIVATALVLSAVILGSYFYQAKHEMKSVKVVGFATKSYQADVVRWQVNCVQPSTQSGLSNSYRKMKANMEALIALLKEKKIQGQ